MDDLKERIQEDRVIAYLFRRTRERWQAVLPEHAPMPALPERDKACADLFWELVADGVLIIEIDDDCEVCRILPGPNFGGEP